MFLKPFIFLLMLKYIFLLKNLLILLILETKFKEGRLNDRDKQGAGLLIPVLECYLI